MASENTKNLRADQFVELKNNRWKDKKYLSPINYLRLLRRDLQDDEVIELREKLSKEVKEAKKDFKSFIREFRLRGWMRNKSSKR